jgi:hypothetical protein
LLTLRDQIDQHFRATLGEAHRTLKVIFLTGTPENGAIGTGRTGTYKITKSLSYAVGTQHNNQKKVQWPDNNLTSTSGLTIDGMPASPHQIAVIRGQQQIARKLKTDGSAHQHF